MQKTAVSPNLKRSSVRLLFNRSVVLPVVQQRIVCTAKAIESLLTGKKIGNCFIDRILTLFLICHYSLIKISKACNFIILQIFLLILEFYPYRDHL